MNVFKNILFVLIILIITTCSEKNSEVVFFRINEIVIPDQVDNLLPIKSRIIENRSDSLINIYFQDLLTKKIFVYKFKNSNIYSTSSIENYKDNLYINMFFFNRDSIYIFNSNNNILALKDSTGNIIEKFHFNQEYTPTILLDFDTKENGCSFLFAHASKQISIGKKKERKVYYNMVAPLLKAELHEFGMQIKTMSKFPDNYMTNTNNYFDPYPSACFGYNNLICVSFSADENLYLYQDTNLVLTKKVKSKYIKQFNPYPDDKQFDMLFLKNYIQEEPKFIGIVFDPWENLYYRIVKHRAQGTSYKNDHERNWSVIVLDKDLNILGEKKFSESEFDPRVLVPTPFGILFRRIANTTNKNIVFTLMKINKND